MKLSLASRSCPLVVGLLFLFSCGKPNHVEYAGNIPLTLTNDSGENICAVRMAPSTDEEWGDNWLQDDAVIGPATQHVFMVRDQPAWSVQVGMCGGHLHEAYQLALNAALELSLSSMSRVTTTVTVYNDYSDNLCVLRMTRSGDYWGGDWIGDGYHLPPGNEQTFIIRMYDSLAMQMVMCGGEVREHFVAGTQPVVVNVTQATKVTSTIELFNDLGVNVCEVYLAGAGDSSWGNNWLDYNTYVPAGNNWWTHVRKLDNLAVRAVTCEGWVYEASGYSSQQDSQVSMSWLALVYTPPEPQQYVQQDQGGHDQGGHHGGHQGGHDQGGYDQGGYQGGHDQGGHDQGGHDQDGTLKGDCSLSDPPRCDGDAIVSCMDVGGYLATHREICPHGCRNALCIFTYQLCTPRFANGGTCPSECDYSNAVIVDGNHYCTSSCGPNGECPSGTACTDDRMCLPPCRTASDCPKGFLPFCGDSGFCGRI